MSGPYSCSWNGKWYYEGERFRPSECTECSCSQSTVNCRPIENCRPRGRGT